MLKLWKVTNFKSVQETSDLELAPITLFVGANSSGKSTIIQSILLIKQTIRFGQAQNPITLNGPLLKLGHFLDVKSANSITNSIHIKWKLEPKNLGIPDHFRKEISYRNVAWEYTTERTAIGSVTCNFGLEVDPNRPNDQFALLQPSLLSASLTVGMQEADETEFRNFSINRLSIGENRKAVDRLSSDASAHALGREIPKINLYEVSVDEETRDEILEGHVDGEILYADSRHFFPNNILIRYDEGKENARQLAAYICAPDRSPSAYRMRRDFSESEVPESVTSIIREWASENDAFLPNQMDLFAKATRISVGDLSGLIREALMKLRFRSARNEGIVYESARRELRKLQDKVESIFLTTAKASTRTQFASSGIFDDATMVTNNYFYQMVRYLGPLRNEPQAVYPLEALEEPTDVGTKGENTAAVLHLNKNTLVTYYPPSIFESDVDTSKPVSLPLMEAIADWLSYMGVAEAANTEDQGKFGYDLRVRLNGLSKFHDLTNVGVGVSQLLPIVVMSLLSEPGSLLIFEQPELHLHPKVQSRLADFFISMALSGKQCILESHSEYLVHRLRRRIAESKSSTIRNLTKIYFVERSDGNSSYREVAISDYGAINDWPKDFFDESEKEITYILQAAQRKRQTVRDSKA